MPKIIRSIFYLFFPLFIGGIISFFIRNSIDYTSLIQPPLAPPKVLFPIAWTILYLFMGISYFVYKKQENDEDLDKIVYYLQLFVNAMWSLLFFLWKLRFFSILWILFLDILVLLCIFLFYKKSKVSGYLLIPYLLWILFATYLTIGIYILN